MPRLLASLAMPVVSVRARLPLTVMPAWFWKPPTISVAPSSTWRSPVDVLLMIVAAPMSVLPLRAWIMPSFITVWPAGSPYSMLTPSPGSNASLLSLVLIVVSLTPWVVL